MRAEKIKIKYMKGDMWKSFFHKLADWHLTTALQINFSQIVFRNFKYLLRS